MKQGYATYTTDLEFKVETEGTSDIVSGYFSAFNVLDSDRDVIRKGSFLKSIQEHGPNSQTNRKIAHLFFHDTTRPIGKILELKEDEKGLFFRSELGKHTEGRDALELYKSLIIREHSIGFNYVKDKIKFVDAIGSDVITDAKQDRKVGYFDITEVKLWEGSAVVFGANSETPNTTGIKSQQDLNNLIDKTNERMSNFIKAIKDGNLSEKYNNLVETELYFIQKQYNSLLSFEPNNTQKTKEVESKEENKKRYLY